MKSIKKQINKRKIILRKNAFTLIELIIVVSMIAILAAVVLVSLNKTKIRSNEAAFKSTMSSISRAVVLCCTEVGNHLLSIGGGNVCDPPMSNILPLASDLKLGSGTVQYSRINDCGSVLPQLNVVISGAGTLDAVCNTTYEITTSGIFSGTGPINHGFPDGC